MIPSAKLLHGQPLDVASRPEVRKSGSPEVVSEQERGQASKFPSDSRTPGLPDLRTAPVNFTGISRDSRKVRAGDLFVAVGGDERTNALNAIANGASAVLAEHHLDLDVAELLSPHARWSFAK